MSVQSSLDPYGSNTTLSSCGSDVGSDQKQHSGIINTPNLKVIVHKPDEFTYNKVNTTEKCQKQEVHIEKSPNQQIDGSLQQQNFKINNQDSEEVSGLYIRLMLRRKDQHDTVSFYKTHKF
ncbi:hypothetical protein PV326_006232 [Microctonus aethiopoides]|nr:hypothetical protein PV326_006232 [Microctonus aethiopoides]